MIIRNVENWFLVTHLVSLNQPAQSEYLGFGSIVSCFFAIKKLSSFHRNVSFFLIFLCIENREKEI